MNIGDCNRIGEQMVMQGKLPDGWPWSNLAMVPKEVIEQVVKLRALSEVVVEQAHHIGYVEHIEEEVN